MNKNLMIIAGEASGDMHGASLIEEILKTDSSIKIYGIGGDKMIKAGLNEIFHIRELAFLGFTEIIKHIPYIRRVQKKLLSVIESENIKEIVLIDYPGFNLNLAKKVKKLGLKIVYYISPQVWAWGKGRVKKIQKLVDKMLVVFPFEKDFYSKENVDVEFVGHPLLERLNNYNFIPRDDFFAKYNLKSEKEILLLMPGSRVHEIEKLFPEMIKAAAELSQKFNLQIVIACSSNIDESIFINKAGGIDHVIIKEFTYELLKYSKFGIIKSGTSTLEAGLFQMPAVVVYSTSAVTYFIGKLLVNIKNIAMANLIAGETIYPELIQNDARSNRIVNESEKILGSPELLKTMKVKLAVIQSKLGETGASKKAAGFIIEGLNES
ncbi:MAG: lipid-A-disaccharide synthase [Melioribacteraceae bacterium]|nr:lipid-A-disaccharide synthase [Melioribacteraceae bacterium]MCF8353505.1 lipid-A-disaccharide synthase [Melioribacteraceae bacterium]MCF8392634.1 lipid-A-disaccharide synthase [Melioribacteraceae bacterium]MCF8418494.1 lipid-A-disaccharide synthase [Melioribacteraceae bacterium]